MNSEDELWTKGFTMIGKPLSRDVGYEILITLSRSVMHRYLRKMEVSRDDHEDIVSAVATRLWEDRTERVFPSLVAFKAFVKLSADNERKDRRASAHSRHNVPPGEADETADEASEEFIRHLEDQADYRRHLGLADDLWLGKKPKDHQHRTIAANMLFWDKKRLSVVTDVVKRLAGAPKEIKPLAVVEWASDIAVVRRLTYAKMHYEPEDLFYKIVGEMPLDPNREAVLLWRRFVHFNSRRKLIDALPEDERESAQKMLDEFEAKLPFAPSFETILTSLRRYEGSMSAFMEAGLWKRLVFQYSLYRLPHEDMVGWFGDSAQSVGFTLDKTKVHGWIAVGRLKQEIRDAFGSGDWN